jgi:hypothetical protein
MLLAIVIAARAGDELALAVAAGPPPWPIELAPDLPAGTTRRARAERAVSRAAEWMAAFPAAELRFDAAVILAGIRRTVDGDALRRAFAAARPVADHDGDNPQRRFWIAGFESPRQHTAAWRVPAAGEARANTNRPVAEALHCARNGWRPETTAYVCGPMRDGGGYHTAHGLWALALARENGCVTDAASRSCVGALAEELIAAQPATLAPATTLDMDLYAERVMVLAYAGTAVPRLDDWIDALLERQAADGSWGVPARDEPPYHRYHATGVSAWALAEWMRRAVPRAPDGAAD